MTQVATDRFGAFGGRYVPETLSAALDQLERAYAEASADRAFAAELDELLSQIDADQEFNAEVGEGPRGRTSGNRRPSLPDGWLDSCDLDGEAAALVAAAEISVSGG